jgi:hypothetical protein
MRWRLRGENRSEVASGLGPNLPNFPILTASPFDSAGARIGAPGGRSAPYRTPETPVYSFWWLGNVEVGWI